MREVVDDANDVLLAPFVDLIDSDSAWVNHGVPTLLALLLYGVGLGFLANMMPKPRAHGSDWRAALFVAPGRSLIVRRATSSGRGCCRSASQAPSPRIAVMRGTGEPMAAVGRRGRIADPRFA